MKSICTGSGAIASVTLVFLFVGCFGGTIDVRIDKAPFEVPSGIIAIRFSITSDMRSYTGDNINYFRGVCEQIKYGGRGDFMISPGDIDPPDKTFSTIQSYIGSDYTWYPLVGNHEIDPATGIQWLRDFNPLGNSLPNVVAPGPPGCVETTFSFEYGNVHFVFINEYYDGASDSALDGDITDPLYSWIGNDLATNTKPIVFVIGHEPAYPMPDKESGRIEHLGDSLDKYPADRDRFWSLLSTYDVKAYICGHTHSYSTFYFNNVWQIDAGHSRGTADLGSKSTFIMCYVMADNSVWLYTYRLNYDMYTLYERVQL